MVRRTTTFLRSRPSAYNSGENAANFEEIAGGEVGRFDTTVHDSSKIARPLTHGMIGHILSAEVWTSYIQYSAS